MNKQIILILLYGSIGLIKAMDNNHATKLAIICAPYADVMLELKPNIHRNHQDPNQDTQALYFEPVTILSKCPGWYKVATTDQMKVETKDNRITYIPHEGWVEEQYVALQEPYAETDTSFPIIVQSRIATVAFSQSDQDRSKMLEIFAGTKLYARLLDANPNSYEVKLIDDQTKKFSTGYINKTDVRKVKDLKNFNISDKRKLIIEHAEKFLNTPYFWGGMTSNGIDCSGLTHLAYRMAGMQIPRDSKDQKAGAKECAPQNLLPGDLIFLTRVNDKIIRHVMLYGGSDQIIDAIGTDAFGTKWEKVRKTTGQKWLGKPFTQMEQGEVVGPYVVYGGTFLQ